MTGALELLASPGVLFSLAVVLFLGFVRSPWPWTRQGGVVLLAALLAASAAMLWTPEARHLVLRPARLPVLLLLLSSVVALWVNRHQSSTPVRRSTGEGVPARGGAAAWRGLSSTETLVGGGVVLAVAITAFFAGAPLGRIADPARPAGEDAVPWFVLPLSGMQAFFDPWVAMVLMPLLTVASLAALPFLDLPEKERDGGQRQDALFFFLFVWFLLVLMPMATAAYLRDPGASDLGRPLSVLLWALVADEPPLSALVRESPGILGLAVYFFILPRQLPRWGPTRAVFGRYRRRLGAPRFHLAMALMQLWLLVPLKMYGRWLAGIEYFVYLPEISFSF